MYFSFLALLSVRQTGLEAGAQIPSRMGFGPAVGEVQEIEGARRERPTWSESCFLPCPSVKSVGPVGSGRRLGVRQAGRGVSHSKRRNTPLKERKSQSWRGAPSKKQAEQDKCNGLPSRRPQSRRGGRRFLAMP